ncbi:MAG TPA: glycosyltransferase family 2 protein [Caulobacteraceae bacterium]|jgi:hypothetical protein|nr:glycosyltransferase family 2 protein [Caulobacteraceae bacterium]
MPHALELQVVKKAAPTTGLALFAMVRNEDYFLPYFFAHYRALGIEDFLIYDDRSDSITEAFLHAQADCSILASANAYGDTFGLGAYDQPRRLPAALKESVPPWAFPDRWVLTVDADEFLVLPPGFADLKQLTRRLDAIGQPYLSAPMVDFYGPTLNHRNYPRHLSPFEGSPMFDVGPYYEWTGEHGPTRFPAGIRHRLHRMLRDRHRAQFDEIYGDFDDLGVPIPWKAPLLKNGVGVVRNGDHELNLAPSTSLTGALAHFKFYPDLDAKIRTALEEGQYTKGSAHYRFLDLATRLLGAEPLVGPESRTFSGPESLEMAGLMQGEAMYGEGGHGETGRTQAGRSKALPGRPTASLPPPGEVSAVVVCKGRLAHLKETLPHLMALPLHEVVVVDYDCPDRCGDWVAAQFPAAKVRRIENQPILNISAARNRGAETATGAWLLFIDADVRVSPDLYAGPYSRPEPDVFLVADPLPYDLVGTIFLRRGDFDELGGYDEVLQGWGAEDRELIDRLEALGRRAACFDGTLMSCIAHDDQLRTRHYANPDRYLNGLVNGLYRWAKRDLSRQGVALDAAALEQIYAQVRAGFASGRTPRNLEIVFSRRPLFDRVLTTTLRYEIGGRNGQPRTDDD